MSLYISIKSIRLALRMRKHEKRWRAEELKIKSYIESCYQNRDYFNNSDKNLKFYNLREGEYRMFYDTTWTVDVLENGQMKYITLTLNDTYHNHIEKVMKELIDCKTTDDIEKLDQRENIYYD